ncbi:kinase-like domain-containing protein, partial [Rhizophagus irregularis DAOM 181602=DAOM 197198]|uniref:Gin4p n=2 Tax=Rhizophagus irregularis TaxID=588596 RepID=A0A015L6I7_RHIIW
MSNNKDELQTSRNSDKWTEEVISKNNIKYYEYNNFYNIERIDDGDYENVYRANIKNSDQYFVLKSFNLDNATILCELKLYRKLNFHENIIKFFGITDNKENRDGQVKKYLVMEYADGGTFRKYLRENFENLTWNDKINLAFQLSCAVSYLHDEKIVHRDLHSNNVLIHQNNIKLTDFGLSKRIDEKIKLFGTIPYIPYIDPKCFNGQRDNQIQTYLLNEKSDIYSVGVLLWEISSGKLPFDEENYDLSLMYKISQGLKETPIPNTPEDYIKIYTECWNNEPINRPTIIQVVDKLKTIITETNVKQSENVPNLNRELPQIIQNFMKSNIIEIEPTTQNINKSIFEEDLSIIIDELVNLYFKELNEGKEESVRKQHIFDYINNHKLNLQEIYNWLLNNQNDSNSVYLLGYFNYHGIKININKQKAYELYQKAAKLENSVAQVDLTYMYVNGKGVDKNYNKAFELSKKLAEREHSNGINMLGYCYDLGIGTDIDMQKAFELYQKSANLGNIKAQYNLALMYEEGKGTEINQKKAFELSKKSAKGEYSDGINLLGYYYKNGIGTDVNMEKAVEFYQKAANLGLDVAQYNLALMYENGNGIKKDINQAIYWYKKSAKQGFQSAQTRLNNLQE